MDKLNLLQQIITLQKQLLELLALRKAPQGNTNREKLFNTALSCLGTDASPNDVAPDEYGCAETVNEVHKKCFGFPIGGELSTYKMYAVLKSSPLFTKVDSPLNGDIIISPTGYGNGKLSNGHVGIMAFGDKIMSNNSYTGKFEQNYNLATWRARYKDIGNYPVDFFRRV